MSNLKVVALGEPPYANGFQSFRFRALMRAMRELPLSANAAEIQARADRHIYARSGIYFDADRAQWVRQESFKPAEKDEGEE